MEKINGKRVYNSPKPDYLKKFIEWVVKNLNEFASKVNTQEAVDWRIKEALMHAISIVKEHILKSPTLKTEIEKLLKMYVLPELSNDQKFIRARACQVYDAYGELCYEDSKHIEQIMIGIFKNMSEQ